MPRLPKDRSRVLLSKLARHLCIPEGIKTTVWPRIESRALEMGFSFDRWQQGIGMVAFGKRADGVYAASTGGVVLSIPRQTGKTYLVSVLLFALCSLDSDLKAIWTAHHLRTSDSTFLKMAAMARKPAVAGYVESVRYANGQQQITFKNGSVIMFGARERGFGRGEDKIDVLVLDEAQILTEDAMSNMVPATNAVENSLVFMMGTPPRPRDPGFVFRDVRDAALAGDKDIFYVEFSADRGAKPGDWAQLAKANPSFPQRTSRTAIERMRKLVGSDDNFRREAYGVWDEVHTEQALISSPQWQVLENDDMPDGVKCFGVKFSHDGAFIGLGAAVRPFAGGTVTVGGVRLAETTEGLQWLVDFLAARKRKIGQIIIDGKAGAPVLIDALLDAGFRTGRKLRPESRQLRTLTLGEYQAAHAAFLAAITEQEVFHDGGDLLTEQVLCAKKRLIGTQGGWGWAGIHPDQNVSLLDAVTLAFYGAKTTKRNPHRSMEVSF